jgi:hypothetical protein
VIRRQARSARRPAAHFCHTPPGRREVGNRNAQVAPEWPKIPRASGSGRSHSRPVAFSGRQRSDDCLTASSLSPAGFVSGPHARPQHPNRLRPTTSGLGGRQSRARAEARRAMGGPLLHSAIAAGQLSASRHGVLPLRHATSKAAIPALIEDVGAYQNQHKITNSADSRHALTRVHEKAGSRKGCGPDMVARPPCQKVRSSEDACRSQPSWRARARPR